MKKAFILNKTTTLKKDVASSFTINFLPKSVRHAELEGKKYLVVPMVMMTEGVHAGSDGPLFYPKDELAKTPVIWNHKPVVVYHPEINGQALSACTPEILASRKVGLIMNAKFSGNALKAEAWIDEDKVDRVDNRIRTAIEKNQMMEVSTGLFVDVEEEAAKWGDEDYSGIARNYRPDHLALLPDQIGACSIADGAGLLRNEKKIEAQKDFRAKLIALKSKSVLKINELSFDDIDCLLWAALCARLGVPSDLPVPTPNIVETYSNFIIYSYGGQLFQISYETTDDAVILGTEMPVPVKRVEQYVPLNSSVQNATTLGGYLATDKNGAKHLPTEKNGKVDHDLMGEAWAALHEGFRGNKYDGPDKSEAIAKLTALYKSEGLPLPTQNNQKNTMNKKEMIDGIIAANQGWQEADRPKLDAFSDEQVKQFHGAITNTTKEIDGNTVKINIVAGEPKKPVQLSEWLQTVPPELQGQIRNGLAMQAAEKTRVIAAISANANNPFTKEQLEAKELSELQALSKLAAIPQVIPNYSGLGEQIHTNRETGEEALEVPVMNFAKS